jgi:DNA polymerase-1
MNALELLHQISALDISLMVVEGKLWGDAPKGTITPQLRAQLLQQKADLIALLAGPVEEPQTTCLYCGQEVAFYDEDGRAYCSTHRYRSSQRLCSASPALVRVTQAPFFTQDLAELSDEVSAMEAPVVLDLETTGLDPLRDRIVSIAVGTIGRVSIIDLRPYYALEASRQAIWRGALSRLFSLPVTWVGHNLKFDWLFLAAQLGIRIARVYDTMLVEQLLHGVGLHDTALSVGLRETAARYQIPVTKEQRAWFPGLDTRREEWHAPFPPEQLRYMVQDIEAPARIYQAQQPRIQEQKLAPVVELEQQALPAIASMELHGVLIDQERWRAILRQKGEREQQLAQALSETLGAALQKRREAHERALHEEERRLMQRYQQNQQNCSWEAFLKQGMATWKASHPFPAHASEHGLNLASSVQVLCALSELGVQVSSTREEVLAPYAERLPVVATLLQWKKVQKFRSAFGENLLARIGQDGRLRGDFAQIGAVSGRIICRSPNLQQIPAHEKNEAENLRCCFIAPSGYRLLKADLSNIELRILAEVSGDAVMLRLFAEGRDLHAETAKVMFGLPPDTDTRARQYKEGVSMRDVAKTINFGLAYGMGAQGLANRIGVSVETAKALMQTYFTTYAGVARWLRSTARQALQQGYAVTLAGRRRPFIVAEGMSTEMRGTLERSAKNHPIQGTNADILKRALALLYAELPEAVHIVLAVHDEIVLECPEDLLEEAGHILKDTMVRACRTYLKVVAIPEPEVIEASYWKKE